MQNFQLSASDITPSKSSRNYGKLLNFHNNRLGAVYDAIYSFMEIRAQTRQRSLQSPLINRDTVSLILFDDKKVDIAFENKKNMDANLLFNKMLEYKATKYFFFFLLRFTCSPDDILT